MSPPGPREALYQDAHSKHPSWVSEQGVLWTPYVRGTMRCRTGGRYKAPSPASVARSRDSGSWLDQTTTAFIAKYQIDGAVLRAIQRQVQFEYINIGFAKHPQGAAMDVILNELLHRRQAHSALLGDTARLVHRSSDRNVWV